MTSRASRIVTLPRDRQVYMVSDLHLGDGTPSDVFFGKDRHLMALVERANRDGATLVVNGDAIDFHQAWSFMRVLRAHQELLAAMSALAREGRLIYVVGNHDFDLSLFSDVLNFRVCNEIHIGDEVMICHGYRYDAYISSNIDGFHLDTKIHHAVERFFGTWVRFPFGEFYTLANRIAVWLGHKIGLAALARGTILRWLGTEPDHQKVLDALNHWAWSNQGDSMCIFRPALDSLRAGPWRVIICGHSHLPGVVRDGDKIYANTGSWTFASSQYIVWDGHDVQCHDWITGRRFEDELYRPLIDGSIYERDFFQWWRENYMGWLRFREGEERRGVLRGWESYIRDYQHLSNLRPMDVGRGPADVPYVEEDLEEEPSLDTATDQPSPVLVVPPTDDRQLAPVVATSNPPPQKAAKRSLTDR